MPSRLPSVCEDELMAACLASHASALSCARWRVHMRFGALPSHTLHSITSGLCIGRSLTRPPTTYWGGCATMCNSQTTKECLEVLTLVRAKDAFFEHYKR